MDWRIVLLALCIGACAPRREVEGCAGSERERAVATLMFGRNVGAREGVSEAAWERFVDLQITPRFPDGLTVTDGAGQWRDAKNGQVVHERSKIVTLVLGEDEAKARADLDAVAAAYERQFGQQSVGVVIERSCVKF
jgi:Protein of unknown function (DUF3574)